MRRTNSVSAHRSPMTCGRRRETEHPVQAPALTNVLPRLPAPQPPTRAEVLSGKGYSGFGADVWSVGICLFAMLAGFFPLDEATNRDWRYERASRAVATGASITHTIYGFYQRRCSLSAEAVALLDGMLMIDPVRRLSLEQVTQSPWLNGQKLPTAGQGAHAGGAFGDEEPRYRSANLPSALASATTPAVLVQVDEPVYRGLAATAEVPPPLGRQPAFGAPSADM